MLFGRKFTLHTDHKPLLNIFGSKKGIPVYTANRLQRWALILLAYDFEIKYTNTQDFGHADVLSRLIDNHEKDSDDFIIASISMDHDMKSQLNESMINLPVSYNMILQATKNDVTLQKVLKLMKNGWPENRKNLDTAIIPFFDRRESLSEVDNILMFNTRILIPEIFRNKILKQLHRGHISYERSKAIARSYVYWPNIDKDIENYNRKCPNCQLNATNPVKTNLCSWPVTSRPLQRVHINYAGPVKGKYYLVIVDAHSKYPVICESNNMTTTSTIKLLREFCSLFGNPEQIVSDNGTQFCFQDFESWCNKRGIQHTKTVRFHSNSKGQAEKFVDTLKRALKKSDKEGTSAEILQTFLEVYRSTPNPNTPNKVSPAESFIGRKMRTVFDIILKTVQNDLIRNPKMENQYNNKHGTRNRIFNTGDLVYAKHFRQNKSFWVPGEIIERVGNVIYNVLIQVNDRKILVRAHADQLKFRTPVEQSLQNQNTQLPLDILMNEFRIEPPTSEQFVTPPTSPVIFHPKRITARRQPVETIPRSPKQL